MVGILQVGITYASSPVDSSCFTESATISVSSEQSAKWISVKESADIFFVQNEVLVPYKALASAKPKYMEYTVSSHSSGEVTMLKDLSDGNPATAFSFNNLSDNAKSITLDFGKSLMADSFDYSFDFQHRGSVRFLI